MTATIRRRRIAIAASALSAGVVVLVAASIQQVAGGSGAIPTPRAGETAPVAGAAATTPASSASASPVPAPGGEAELESGAVVADESVANLEGEVSLGTIRSLEGGVAAFTSYATWLVASPASRNEPDQAIGVVASEGMDPADRQMLRGMARDKELTLRPSAGAYRVLGHSGEADNPLAVMTEFIAPLTYGGATRWVVVGGVVSWTPEGWLLDSIRPRQVKQPTVPAQVSGRAATRAAVQAAGDGAGLPGVGWRTYANAAD